MKTKLFETNANDLTRYSYEFQGYGVDSEAIYAERVQVYTIAGGKIQDYIKRNCTADGKTYTNFIR